MYVARWLISWRLSVGHDQDRFLLSFVFLFLFSLWFFDHFGEWHKTLQMWLEIDSVWSIFFLTFWFSDFLSLIGFDRKLKRIDLPDVLSAYKATILPIRWYSVPKRSRHLLCGRPIRRVFRLCCRTRPLPRNSVQFHKEKKKNKKKFKIHFQITKEIKVTAVVKMPNRLCLYSQSSITYKNFDSSYKATFFAAYPSGQGMGEGGDKPLPGWWENRGSPARKKMWVKHVMLSTKRFDVDLKGCAVLP